MSVRVIEDVNDGLSVIYDSVTETAFGPVFHGTTTAQDFLDWYAANNFAADLRVLRPDQLMDVYALFIRDTQTDDSQ